MRKCLIALLFVVVLVGCGDADGNKPPSHPSTEYTSECDQFGNRVYITEDDIHATPAIFVIPGDCKGDK